MGEGLKPLTTSQTPSESSHSAHGIAASDAREQGAGFQDAHADDVQRDPFVLPLHHRVQHDGRADAGEGDDYLQDASEHDAGVRTWANDVVRIVNRAIKSESRDRDKGEQVENARGKGGRSMWTHHEVDSIVTSDSEPNRALKQPFGHGWSIRS